MTIRSARPEDLPEILSVYEAARAFMRKNGNLHQWTGGYPQKALLEEDIAKGQLFVFDTDGAVHAAFAFIPGADPTYAYIEGGQWLNDRPYGTIHRIGSDGTEKGIVRAALKFALTKTSEVRADTHADNFPMQRALEKCGFVRCGTIYLENGDPRIAYQFAKEAVQ